LKQEEGIQDKDDNNRFIDVLALFPMLSKKHTKKFI
jgi:hypothetical protein